MELLLVLRNQQTTYLDQSEPTGALQELLQVLKWEQLPL